MTCWVAVKELNSRYHNFEIHYLLYGSFCTLGGSFFGGFYNEDFNNWENRWVTSLLETPIYPYCGDLH